MPELPLIEDTLESKIKKVSEFFEPLSFNKIINKLTDYAEIITAGKLAGIINFNYRLDSVQSRLITDILLDIKALTKVYSIALKGARDLEEEYVSNIFSDPISPTNISSYISLRTILENRLSHQVQQYNMNMGKTNTTLAMPLNELRGHVRTYIDLSSNDVSVSTKAYHGFIAASLHDAYVIIMNRADWWNDRTYMKFFLNEDDPSRQNRLLITKENRVSLSQISENIKETQQVLEDIRNSRINRQTIPQENSKIITDRLENGEISPKSSITYTDRLLQTPFGKQYGRKIDIIIEDIFSSIKTEEETQEDIRKIESLVYPLFISFQELPDSLNDSTSSDTAIRIVNYLLGKTYGIKTFAERFLYQEKKIPFSRFFSGESKDMIEMFLNELFKLFIEKKFNSLFKVTKSLDMKKYACAFSIKRIYLSQGDSLTPFGYFLVKTLAKIGRIKS